MQNLITRNEFDKTVLKEAFSSYKLLKITDKDTVMDVGGNIGGFVAYAAKFGPKRIVSYEPEPSNHQLMVRNTKEFKFAEPVYAAVVSDDADHIELYLNWGENKGLHSTRPYRGRESIRVPAVNFKAELERVKPTILKMDCEGSEYDLMPGVKFAPELTQIAMEFHLKIADWRERARKIDAELQSQGFVPVKPMPEEFRTWALVMTYSR